MQLCIMKCYFGIKLGNAFICNYLLPNNEHCYKVLRDLKRYYTEHIYIYIYIQTLMQ